MAFMAFLGATPQGGTAPAVALVVRHLPVAEVAAGSDLVLRAEVNPAWRLGSLLAQWRVAGDPAWQKAAFERSPDGGMVAVVPGGRVQRPAIEYYLSARDVDGTETLPFASASQPHPVAVLADPATLHREAIIEVYGRRRSRAAVFGEAVSYGVARTPVGDYPDWYMRAEADYLYRIFGVILFFRIDTIRIGMGTMRAQTAPEQAWTAPPLSGTPPASKTGLDYGYAETELSFNPYFGIAGRLVLGGSARGFAAGVGGRMRIGRPRAARVEIEADTVNGIGATGGFRMAWDTVEGLPMSATIQVTNVPSGPAGIRISYRIDWEMKEWLTVGAQFGYQARAALGGGLSAGLATAVAW